MRIGIIGADIVGSYLAWNLAEMGHEVKVFDKNNDVGIKACSGLISERIWNFIPRDENLIKANFRKIKVNFPGKNIELNLSHEMHLIDRNMLDNYVLDMAREAGAEIYLGSAAVKIHNIKGARPLISVNGRTDKVFEFDYIIGADGAASFVRNQIKTKDPRYRLGILYHKKRSQKNNEINVWPTDHGFKWCIPFGNKEEIGIIENPEVAVKEIKSKSAKSALIPQGLRLSNRKNIALCGDAAGLTKPWSGGGVIWGLSAANILLRTLPKTAKYNRALERYFQPRIEFSRMANKALLLAVDFVPFILPDRISIDSDWLF